MINNATPYFILLNIGLAHHNADWNYKNVCSPFARIFMVIKGHAQVIIDERTIDLYPNHMYLIPPFTEHSYRCSEVFSLYYLHVYESPSSVKRFLEEYHFPTTLEISDDSLLLMTRLYHLNQDKALRNYNPQTYDNSDTLIHNLHSKKEAPLHIILESRSIIDQFFARFFEKATPYTEAHDSRIQKCLSFIRHNINRPLSTEELSHVVFMSREHFIRLFKKDMNMTPLQYILQRKMEKAQLLLLTKQYSIKEIAMQLGFDNIPYFHRLFKKIVGKTPLEYITEHSSKDQ